MRQLAAVLLFALSGLVTAYAGEIPRPATTLEWKTPDGQTVDLSRYKGKNICIEVLSTTCPHCQETAGMLSRLMGEFPAKDLQVVGVALNDDANVPEFVRNFNVKFPVGKGNRDQVFAFMQQSLMRSFYFPGLIFIDRNGVIQGQYSGSDNFVTNGQEANIRAQLKKLVATPAAKPSATSSKTRSRKAS